MSVHVRMARRVPDLVLKLQQLARPTFVEGRWRKPKISPRKLATIRKSLVAEDVWWPPRPLRDRGADKPLKLKKWERQKEERQRQIEENMRNMPQMVADYRKKIYELRLKTRQKKERSEEETYLIATGKMKEKAPHWHAFKKGGKDIKKKK